MTPTIDPSAPTATPLPVISKDYGSRPQAPLFSGQLMNESEFDLATFIGTPVLLVFWAPW